MTEQLRMPRVTVFSMGGTIASTDDDAATAGGVAPRLGAAELVQAIPQLRQTAELEAVAFRQVSSGDLTLRDLNELAAEISKRFED
ncbi:MAG: L-asparaginase, partial [Pseudonocardiales bacterium]|nr:L-asparaginase [Pseudonocardiales bacterium]